MVGGSRRNRDDLVQSMIAKSTRQLNRRSFMGRVAAAAAVGIATVVVGEAPAAAGNAVACSPPCGRYCGACGDDGSCGGQTVTCTSSDSRGLSRCCPYPAGFWYTSDPAGQKHKCTDCVIAVGPAVCNSSACTSVCGCRSTKHY